MPVGHRRHRLKLQSHTGAHHGSNYESSQSVEQGQACGAEDPLQVQGNLGDPGAVAAPRAGAGPRALQLGIDSKLTACDLVKLRVRHVSTGERVAARAKVMHDDRKLATFKLHLTSPAARAAQSPWPRLLCRGSPLPAPEILDAVVPNQVAAKMDDHQMNASDATAEGLDAQWNRLVQVRQSRCTADDVRGAQRDSPVFDNAQPPRKPAGSVWDLGTGTAGRAEYWIN